MYVRDALNRIRNNSLEIYEKIKSPLNSVSELFDDTQFESYPRSQFVICFVKIINFKFDFLLTSLF